MSKRRSRSGGLKHQIAPNLWQASSPLRPGLGFGTDSAARAKFQKGRYAVQIGAHIAQS